jgi:hypothetical protein
VEEIEGKDLAFRLTHLLIIGLELSTLASIFIEGHNLRFKACHLIDVEALSFLLAG